ncbi:MAG: M48 family metalloprotease [Candidatus Obscuribacterales bacterium]|nr:M48 family metalloprotease [Steroidobacteraceae bacterium]
MDTCKFISTLIVATSLTACGSNPVTGKKEIQFISENSEIKIGEQNYAPARQAEGGEITVMPELTKYVNEVGQKLAAVADRKLPYEFKVLNNSMPNAWAMPGGKISINRGLLTELKSEAELAAVLGHEIVHAAARHGAKAQERGTLLQGALLAGQVGAAIGGVDQNVAGIALAGAGVGAQMVQMKYGREQELDSDEYGMTYMKRAGYDPAGAIGLQEAFVRISKERGDKGGFLEGLFASHPPSPERVEKNKVTAAKLGAGGVIGEQQYRTRIAALTKAQPAYDKYDAATAAMRKKEYINAKNAANEALSLLPQEGRFHELLGEVELAQKNPQAAVPHYEKAIQLNPNYFGAYLGGGIAQFQSGNKAKAQEWLKRSQDLLPTAPAAYYLGNIARERGDKATALQLYKAAANSDSSYGKLAAKEFVEMDLSQNPAQYIATGAQLDAAGNVIVAIQNRSPAPLTDIQVTPVLVDAGGRAVQSGAPLRVPGTLEPGKQVAISAGLGTLSSAQLQALRIRVDGAKVAQ